MIVKKIVFITKCDKKLFKTDYYLEKNCLQVPKMVTPDKKITVCPNSLKFWDFPQDLI